MTTALSTETAEMRFVAPSLLVENALNPRGPVELDMRNDKDRSLFESVRARGVELAIQAFERDRSDGKLGTELVVHDGARRRSAALLADRLSVPVHVIPEPPVADQLLGMLTVNDHREPLTPMQEARAFLRLIADGMTQEEIANALGRAPGHVSKRLSIIRNLPPHIVERLERKEITLEAAYQGSRIADNVGLVDKLLGGRTLLDDKSVIKEVEAELARRKAQQAREKKIAEYASSDTQVVDAQQIANGTVAVLVGAEGIDWQAQGLPRQVWLAMDLKSHGAESCNAVVVDRDNRAIWVCAEPDAHPDVPTQVRYFNYDPPTVMEIFEAHAKANAPADEAVDEADHVEPVGDNDMSNGVDGDAHDAAMATVVVDEAAEPDDGRPSWPSACDAAIVRRAQVRVLTGASTAATRLVSAWAVTPAIDVEGFSWYAASTVVPIIRQLLPESIDDADDVLQALAALDVDRAALIIAIASVEYHLFSDHPDFGNEQRYWDFEVVPQLMVDAYNDFLRFAGVEIGPVEVWWYEACAAAATDGENW